jgi:hypothetical protein
MKTGGYSAGHGRCSAPTSDVRFIETFGRIHLESAMEEICNASSSRNAFVEPY